MTKPSTLADALNSADEDSATMTFALAAGSTRRGRTSRSRAVVIGAVSVLSAIGVLATGLGTATAGTRNRTTTTTATTDTLLSQGRPTTASSQESSEFGAALATDGYADTRWSSAAKRTAWIQVDLGSVSQIHRVNLRWEAAYGSGYQIQTSTTGITWNTIYTTTTGNGGTDDLSGLNGTGRYLRVAGTKRATSWGYSLWELKAYGSPSPVFLPPTPVTPTPVTPTPVAPTPVAPTPVPTAPTPIEPGGSGAAPATVPKAGLPTGTVLHPMNGTVITQAGTVIDGADISDGLVIRASNVVIRRSRIAGTGIAGINVQSGSLTVEDTTIIGFDTAVGGDDYTATRVEVTRGFSDGFKIGDNVTIQDSWCHDMTPAAGAHADCGQVQAGIKNVIVRRNWFDVGSADGNAALFIAPDLGPSSAGPLLVENNVLGGGNYTLQCVDGNNGDYFIDAITIRNNQFLNNSQYGPMRINVPADVTGNIYKDTLKPV